MHLPERRASFIMVWIRAKPQPFVPCSYVREGQLWPLAGIGGRFKADARIGRELAVITVGYVVLQQAPTLARADFEL
jgi:hypothetical protein